METQQTQGALSAPPFPFQLQDVRVFEISAQIQEAEEEREGPTAVEVGLSTDDSPPDADEFGLLLRFVTGIPFGSGREYSILIAIEGRFEVTTDIATIDSGLLERFKSRDAIILLWPYLRQTFHDLTVRMRLDVPPLPVIDARALVEEPDSSEVADS